MTPPPYSRSSQFSIRRIWGNMLGYWERRRGDVKPILLFFRSLLSFPLTWQPSGTVLPCESFDHSLNPLHYLLPPLPPPPSLPFTVLLLYCLPSMYELDRNRVIAPSFYGRTPLSRVHLLSRFARFGSPPDEHEILHSLHVPNPPVSSVPLLSHFYSRCPFPLWSLSLFSISPITISHLRFPIYPLMCPPQIRTFTLWKVWFLLGRSAEGKAEMLHQVRLADFPFVIQLCNPIVILVYDMNGQLHEKKNVSTFCRLNAVLPLKCSLSTNDLDPSTIITGSPMFPLESYHLMLDLVRIRNSQSILASPLWVNAFANYSALLSHPIFLSLFSERTSELPRQFGLGSTSILDLSSSLVGNLSGSHVLTRQSSLSRTHREMRRNWTKLVWWSPSMVIN